MSIPASLREVWREILGEIRKESRAVVAPFTTGGKLNLSSPHIVGTLPPSRGGAVPGGEALPPGGDTGQVLTKLSGADGDADWDDPSGGATDAADVAYDNAASGLTATDAQAALDELAARPSSSNGYTAPPLVAALTWVNQGASTAADATAPDGTPCLDLIPAAGTTSDNFRMLAKSAPATPYVWTVAMEINLFPNTGGGNKAGILWRESGSGKVSLLAIEMGALYWAYQLQKYNSPSSYSATYGTIQMPAGGGTPLWLRLEDDGTNRHWAISTNGVHFVRIYTVGRTDFITPNQIAVFIGQYTHSDGALRVRSWEEA